MLLDRLAPPRWARSLIVAALCGAGLYVFGQVTDAVYPIRQWLVWQLATVWLWCLVLNIALLGFGAWLTNRIVGATGLPPLEAVVTAVPVGVVGMGLLLYAAGFSGLLRTWCVLALLAGMLAVGARPLCHLWGRLRRQLDAVPRPRTALGRLTVLGALIWSAYFLTFLYLSAMTPAALNHDALWYHIPIAQDYARAGRIIPFPSDYLRALPHLMSLVYSVAFLVPGLRDLSLRWMLTLHIEFTTVLWSMAAVAAGARWMLARQRVSWLSLVFLLFPGIFVYDSHIGGSADHFLGMFAVPLFLATVRAAERFDVRRCVLVAVLAGGATLTKYQAAYLLAASGVILVPHWLWLIGGHLRRRITRRWPTGAPAPVPLPQLLTGAGTLLLLGLAVTAPHFLKNVVFYHNPLYPFAQEVFTRSRPRYESAWWASGFANDLLGEPPAQLGERLREAFKVFFTFSFEPHYSFVGNVPFMGSLFTLTLPVVLLLRRAWRIWAGILATLAGVLAWGLTYYADRYLQCLTPLMAVVVAALLVRGWGLGWMARIGLAALVLFQVAWGGDTPFYNGTGRVDAAIRLISSGFDGRRSDRERLDFQQSERRLGEALPPDARLLLHSVVINLGFDHEVIVDQPGKQGLINYDLASDPRGMWEIYRALGVTHVAHLPDAANTNVCAHDVLFVDFATRFAAKRERFGAWELVTVPDRAPPAEESYHVLSLGIHYRDGLYGIEQMRVHQLGSAWQEKLPAPQVPLPPTAEAQAELVARARAVIVGARTVLEPPVSEALKRQFQTAATYRDRFAIWVRH